MKDKELREQIESLLGVTIDTDEKTIEDEINEILNINLEDK